MALFVGGVADGRTMEVDESKACIVVPHPLSPIVEFTRKLPESTPLKVDLYFRRRYRESDGSISVRYLYGETNG